MKLKLPFVSRKRYEQDKGRIIVYVPTQAPTSIAPPKGYVSLPKYRGKAIGWAQVKEFKNYDEVLAYFNEDTVGGTE